MSEISFTPELVAGIVGVVLSWVFGWFPGLRTWYASKKPEVKSGIMLGLLAVCSTAIFFLAKYGVLPVSNPIGWWDLIVVFFVASTLNQTAYKLTPQSTDVIEINNARTVLNIKGVEPEIVKILTAEDKK